MTPKEQRIEQIKNRIAESKRDLEGSSQVGPIVIIIVGIVLFLTPMMGLGVGLFGIGFIVVLLGIIWSYSKSRQVSKIKEAIFQYERELYNVEKEP
jgi:Zn-dependent membrane protease YugP